MQQYDIAGPRLKVERAERHIRELELVLSKFLAQDPYRIVAEDGGGRLHVFSEVRKKMPAEIPLIIGDAAHNLRSALDLLSGALVHLRGKNPRHARFPFGDDQDIFEKSLKKIKGAGTHVLSAIEDLQPRSGRNDRLVGLHQLDIADKHRVILTTAQLIRLPYTIVGGGFTISSGSGGGFNIPDDIGRHTHIEMPGRVTHQTYGEPTFSIQFGRGEVFSGQPVIETLRELVVMVEYIINHLWALGLRTC